MTQKTVLNEAHRRLGAKMVDFGGWDMPLHYGSQIEEHHAVRGDCGMFDVSHMCAVDVAGKEAKAFLLRLIANNVDKLKEPGKALYSAMLNETGGVIDDLIVYFVADGQYRIVINAGTAEKDLAWMNARLAEWQLEAVCIPRRDLAIIAVQGPNAKSRVWQILPETRAASEPLKPFYAAIVGEYFVATTGYTGETGFEITLPTSQAENFWQKLLDVGVKPIGLGARDTLRLEAGMNLYGQDMDETVSPLDAGLTWTIDLSTDRDFVGKELAAEQEAAVVESVKAASDVYAPVAGTVIETNTAVPDAPELVNQDAYAAWLFKMKPANIADVDALLDAAAYAAASAE